MEEDKKEEAEVIEEKKEEDISVDLDEVDHMIDDVIVEVEENIKKRHVKVTIYNAVRKLIMVAALCVYVYSVYTLTGIYLDYDEGSTVYADVHAMFQTDTDDEEETGEQGGLNWNLGKKDKTKWVWDYNTLLSVNEDAEGWIALKDSKISYPIVQGKDNEYYLHHTVDRAYNFAGTVFVDYRYPDAMYSNYSIIYGHYLKNGTMFAYLNPFQYSDYGNEHNVFDIYIGEKHYHYYVFSVYITKGVETEDSPYQFDVNPVKTDFTPAQWDIYDMSEEERAAYGETLKDKEEEKEQFEADCKVVAEYEEKNAEENAKSRENLQKLIDRIRKKSKYKLASNEYIDDITPDDHILTISTCWVVSENTRMIIHMVRGEEVKD